MHRSCLATEKASDGVEDKEVEKGKDKPEEDRDIQDASPGKSRLSASQAAFLEGSWRKSPLSVASSSKHKVIGICDKASLGTLHARGVLGVRVEGDDRVARCGKNGFPVVGKFGRHEDGIVVAAVG